MDILEQQNWTIKSTKSLTPPLENYKHMILICEDSRMDWNLERDKGLHCPFGLKEFGFKGTL
jgi:hypothetical protein